MKLRYLNDCHMFLHLDLYRFYSLDFYNCIFYFFFEELQVKHGTFPSFDIDLDLYFPRRPSPTIQNMWRDDLPLIQIMYLVLSCSMFISGKGGKNRRRGKNENENEKRELVFKEDGQGWYFPSKLLVLFLVTQFAQS